MTATTQETAPTTPSTPTTTTTPTTPSTPTTTTTPTTPSTPTTTTATTATNVQVQHTRSFGTGAKITSFGFNTRPAVLNNKQFNGNIVLFSSGKETEKAVLTNVYVNNYPLGLTNQNVKLNNVWIPKSVIYRRLINVLLAIVGKRLQEYELQVQDKGERAYKTYGSWKNKSNWRR